MSPCGLLQLPRLSSISASPKTYATAVDHPLTYLYQRKVSKSWGQHHNKMHPGQIWGPKNRSCDHSVQTNQNSAGPIGIHDASLSFSYPRQLTGQPVPRKQTKLPVVASIPQAHCGSAVHHRTEATNSWQ